jgi:hypothetical protein
MYVIIHKNRVILGILPWNSQYFTDVLRSRYRITTELPRNEPALDAFPWEIDAETKIFPAEEIRPNIDNPLVEYYYGPTWEFLETKVIGSYDVLPQSIENARDNYKVKASLQRYEQEVSGTIITIDGVEYKIETDRLSRTKFIEKYIKYVDQYFVTTHKDYVLTSIKKNRINFMPIPCSETTEYLKLYQNQNPQYLD